MWEHVVQLFWLVLDVRYGLHAWDGDASSHANRYSDAWICDGRYSEFGPRDGDVCYPKPSPNWSCATKSWGRNVCG
ncbi:hypothetical protein PF005_g24725 [Phytophthora fragariae]|uniref:Secreted protein n=1 Tax=Phytophthora fragariae TaxID=53985 RepID=A0A6A3HSK3_9STRA|nr:hypothetical protein PF003_g16390 [Phytophthora fragariae]KAE8919133.1 hypothetical protein PF009_g30554 [Phytophthora fragariae]KAE8972611.1 hypothetical protein PF011_g25575 [Phytophthora fragariae]KAE9070371.1 hypothetical protein PF010_g26305 [Phytophthora fragariae]KAE9071610.1 hypothetical protein PF007_g26490 [Phytophthora fragariae]